MTANNGIPILSLGTVVGGVGRGPRPGATRSGLLRFEFRTREGIQSPLNLNQTHTYDGAGQTTNLTTADATTTLAQYGYGYDGAGPLVSDTTTDPILAAVSHTYTYDALNQVLSRSDGTATVGYDPTSAGQLVTIGGTTLAYNSAQQLTDVTPASGPATSFSYDANGSRTNRTVAAADPAPAQSTAYGYDAALNLAAVTLPGDTSPTVSYTSNGDGLRQSRTQASTTSDFLWSTVGGLPLLLDDGTTTYIYGASSTPIAQVESSGSTSYLFGDLIGSVRLITDNSGAVVGTSEYDTYGNRTDHTGIADSLVGYTGNWTEPNTGLVYLRARDYDPGTGQFLTTDPLADHTRQPYAYSSNDPLLLTDPTGLYFNFGSGDPGPLAAAVSRLIGNIGGFLVGIGDGATFWGAESAREMLSPGSTCQIDKNEFYYTGVGVGIGALTIASAGVGDVGLGGNRLIQNAQRVEAEAPTLTSAEEKSIASYQALIAKHTSKLDAYKENPRAYDNDGRLAAAESEEIQQRIIQGRISHLEKEIATFQNNINKIKGAK